MLIAAHLFLGFVTGAVISLLDRGNQSIVWAAAAGSLLPDIVDKPLGHLLLQGSIDYGRIYAHSLLFCAVTACAAVLLARRGGQWALPAAALVAGIAGHQVLDFMWTEPVTWYYPLLGPFVPHHFPGYFFEAFIAELTSPTEWFFLLSLLVLAPYWTGRPAPLLAFYRSLPHGVPTAAFLLALGAAGLAALLTALIPSPVATSLELPPLGEGALVLLALAGVVMTLAPPHLMEDRA